MEADSSENWRCHPPAYYDMISTKFAPTTTTSTTSFNSTPLIEFNISTSNYLYTPSSTIDLYNTSNVSNLNETSSSVFPNYIRTTSMVFCIIIMCLGVIGNVMVPIVIFKTKDMRNSTNIFLVNLSVADLMVLLVCTPTVLVEVNSRPETWVLGKEMCEYTSKINRIRFYYLWWILLCGLIENSRIEFFLYFAIRQIKGWTGWDPDGAIFYTVIVLSPCNSRSQSIYCIYWKIRIYLRDRVFFYVKRDPER
jgi:hypothetical protein